MTKPSASRVPGPLIGALWLLVTTVPPDASATSLVAEVTTGQGGVAASLLADFPVVEGRTHAVLCYGFSRQRGTFPALHQLCGGFDHALSSHWLVSAVLSLSPPTTSSAELRDFLRFDSDHFSLGSTLSVAWQSGGFSDVEYALDATLGITAYTVRQTWTIRDEAGATHRLPLRSNLASLRPGIGGFFQLGDHWELSLRGSYFLYSADPLTVGRITDAQLLRFVSSDRLAEASPERRLLAGRLAEALDGTRGGRLLQADALSGLLTAPLQFELRPTVAYRFNRTIRGELSYVYDRYVPTQGHAHLLATRWTLRLSDAVRLWGAAALQWDLPVGLPPMRTGLVTIGGELTFS